MKPSILPTIDEILSLQPNALAIVDAVERRDEARTILWLVKLWRDSPEYEGNFPKHIRDAIERAFGS